jgi:hypothetical protein
LTVPITRTAGITGTEKAATAEAATGSGRKISNNNFLISFFPITGTGITAAAATATAEVAVTGTGTGTTSCTGTVTAFLLLLLFPPLLFAFRFPMVDRFLFSFYNNTIQ